MHTPFHPTLSRWKWRNQFVHRIHTRTDASALGGNDLKQFKLWRNINLAIPCKRYLTSTLDAHVPFLPLRSQKNVWSLTNWPDVALLLDRRHHDMCLTVRWTEASSDRQSGRGDQSWSESWPSHSKVKTNSFTCCRHHLEQNSCDTAVGTR